MAFIRTPNQQDLSWFIDMDTQNRLELDPPYQRRSVWTSKDKQFFLDTILNNYPCPAIYLQKENTLTGPIYNVVDGKQRLSTVLDFYKGNIRLSSKFTIPRFQGCKFKDLPPEIKAEFFNYIFMVEQIRSDAEVEWGEVFQRVNKNQKTLADQELRHARFDGWLINRAEKETEREIWRKLGVSSKARNARMKDAEFISILMLTLLENRFVGFPQHKIDALYAKYDFDLNSLPEDEAELNFLSTEENSELFIALESGDYVTTKEEIENFETKFNEIITFITAMEKHNSCITLHKKRIFTDLYTLWTIIAFEADLVSTHGPEKIAEIYHEFMSEVDQYFADTKDGKDLKNYSTDIQTYYSNSTGAATEEEPRKSRHASFVEYARSK